MSNRSIAKALGVNPSTIDEDVAGKPANDARKGQGIGKHAAGNPASGARSAGVESARVRARLLRRYLI